jgi:uroporphyrin-III C-methyltransferase
VTVYLVGAGPGDPDLITRRGAAILARADYVVIDRLVDRRLLADVPCDSIIVEVGKVPGQPELSWAQDDISEMLIALGRTGVTVVRLKGGDPFVFGRGGEELRALRNAGVAVEVVPGLSSAFAVPALSGIPVTSRGLSSQVTVVSGHDPSAVEWRHLGPGDRTIVFLMGSAHSAVLAQCLIDEGWPPHTDVAITESGSWASERRTHTSIAGLLTEAVRSPAVIVVGAVAALVDRAYVSAGVDGLGTVSALVD